MIDMKEFKSLIGNISVTTETRQKLKVFCASQGKSGLIYDDGILLLLERNAEYEKIMEGVN